MDSGLSTIFESTEPEVLGTGFTFTEGPLWDPGFGGFYFVDIPGNRLYRLKPGGAAEVMRENTGLGNGTTFDLDGRIIMCQGAHRRVARLLPDGGAEALADRFEGKRFNRPNDVICRSDGSIYFTDLGTSLPLAEWEMPFRGVYRVDLSGTVSLVAHCERPNGLAFSPDERVLYVANTGFTQYINAFELDGGGRVVRRRIFADMSSDEREGVPDGMKVDVEGRVYCTGAGGVWVFAPDGSRIGILPTAEVIANLAFGGADMRTLFLTSSTSVLALRTRTPGIVHPRFRGQ